MANPNKLNRTKNFAIGAMIGTMTIPALAPFAHAWSWSMFSLEGNKISEYSLKHRYETAYAVDCDEVKKYYKINSNNERYIGHPAATYPAHLVFGLIGGFIGRAVARSKEH